MLKNRFMFHQSFLIVNNPNEGKSWEKIGCYDGPDAGGAAGEAWFFLL